MSTLTNILRDFYVRTGLNEEILKDHQQLIEKLLNIFEQKPTVTTLHESLLLVERLCELPYPAEQLVKILELFELTFPPAEKLYQSMSFALLKRIIEIIGSSDEILPQTTTLVSHAFFAPRLASIINSVYENKVTESSTFFDGIVLYQPDMLVGLITYMCNPQNRYTSVVEDIFFHMPSNKSTGCYTVKLERDWQFSPHFFTLLFHENITASARQVILERISSLKTILNTPDCATNNNIDNIMLERMIIFSPQNVVHILDCILLLFPGLKFTLDPNLYMHFIMHTEHRHWLILLNKIINHDEMCTTNEKTSLFFTLLIKHKGEEEALAIYHEIINSPSKEKLKNIGYEDIDDLLFYANPIEFSETTCRINFSQTLYCYLIKPGVTSSVFANIKLKYFFKILTPPDLYSFFTQKMENKTFLEHFFNETTFGLDFRPVIFEFICHDPDRFAQLGLPLLKVKMQDGTLAWERLLTLPSNLSFTQLQQERWMTEFIESINVDLFPERRRNHLNTKLELVNMTKLVFLANDNVLFNAFLSFLTRCLTKINSIPYVFLFNLMPKIFTLLKNELFFSQEKATLLELFYPYWLAWAEGINSTPNLDKIVFVSYVNKERSGYIPKKVGGYHPAKEDLLRTFLPRAEQLQNEALLMKALAIANMLLFPSWQLKTKKYFGYNPYENMEKGNILKNVKDFLLSFAIEQNENEQTIRLQLLLAIYLAELSDDMSILEKTKDIFWELVEYARNNNDFLKSFIDEIHQVIGGLPDNPASETNEKHITPATSSIISRLSFSPSVNSALQPAEKDILAYKPTSLAWQDHTNIPAKNFYTLARTFITRFFHPNYPALLQLYGPQIYMECCRINNFQEHGVKKLLEASLSNAMITHLYLILVNEWSKKIFFSVYYHKTHILYDFINSPLLHTTVFDLFMDALLEARCFLSTWNESAQQLNSLLKSRYRFILNQKLQQRQMNPEFIENYNLFIDATVFNNILMAIYSLCDKDDSAVEEVKLFLFTLLKIVLHPTGNGIRLAKGRRQTPAKLFSVWNITPNGLFNEICIGKHLKCAATAKATYLALIKEDTIKPTLVHLGWETEGKFLLQNLPFYFLILLYESADDKEHFLHVLLENGDNIPLLMQQLSAMPYDNALFLTPRTATMLDAIFQYYFMKATVTTDHPLAAKEIIKKLLSPIAWKSATTNNDYSSPSHLSTLSICALSKIAPATAQTAWIYMLVEHGEIFVNYLYNVDKNNIESTPLLLLFRHEGTRTLSFWDKIISRIDQYIQKQTSPSDIASHLLLQLLALDKLKNTPLNTAQISDQPCFWKSILDLANKYNCLNHVITHIKTQKCSKTYNDRIRQLNNCNIGTKIFSALSEAANACSAFELGSAFKNAGTLALQTVGSSTSSISAPTGSSSSSVSDTMRHRFISQTREQAAQERLFAGAHDDNEYNSGL